MERKIISFKVDAIDEETGVITGYGATFSDKPDSYGDIIDKGAFTKTLKENSDSIVSLFNHSIMDPIGLPELKQDSNGLLAKIHLVMDLQKARDTLALARAGVIKKMSIGYDTVKSEFIGGIRHLKEVKLYDVSPVIFAANPEARILSVKAATTFDDLPLADRDREWDASAAERRVRAWAGGEEVNWDKYRRAFMWYDSDDPELFGNYKLGFADVIDGKLTAIPRAIFAIAAVLKGGRGGVDIPDADRGKVITHVNKYYDKMDMESPLKGEDIEMEVKEGRVLSKNSLEKVQAALDALQALVESVEKEPEPDKSTPPSDADKQAAEMESIMDGIKAELSGFDARKSEARIDEFLERLKEVTINA